MRKIKALKVLERFDLLVSDCVVVGDGNGMEDIIGEIYDLIRTIRDPERPESLEDLDVVREEWVQVDELGEDFYDVIVYYKPTVEH